MEVYHQNNAVGSKNELWVSDGLTVITCRHEADENLYFGKEIDQRYIQFHFCLKGSVSFRFNEGGYVLKLEGEESLLLYDPRRELPMDVVLEPHSWLISVLIAIREFHALFSPEVHYVDFLNKENKDKKYYKRMLLAPPVVVALHQLINARMHASLQNLYVRGKVYELLSLYFNTREDTDAEACPFLLDEANVLKIRKAKELALAYIAEPPSLPQLAHAVGLNLKKLKVGFKQVYGKSVYGFLFDYKMEYARKMLQSGACNVNEVSLRIGYSTPSHFITGFKKKYGTTPKKYVMNRQ